MRCFSSRVPSYYRLINDVNPTLDRFSQILKSDLNIYQHFLHIHVLNCVPNKNLYQNPGSHDCLISRALTSTQLINVVSPMLDPSPTNTGKCSQRFSMLSPFLCFKLYTRENSIANIWEQAMSWRPCTVTEIINKLYERNIRSSSSQHRKVFWTRLNIFPISVL